MIVMNFRRATALFCVFAIPFALAFLVTPSEPSAPHRLSTPKLIDLGMCFVSMLCSLVLITLTFIDQRAWIRVPLVFFTSSFATMHIIGYLPNVAALCGIAFSLFYFLGKLSQWMDEYVARNRVKTLNGFGLRNRDRMPLYMYTSLQAALCVGALFWK
jgi:hypothetical protein